MARRIHGAGANTSSQRRTGVALRYMPDFGIGHPRAQRERVS
jgi:ectoine hydroxylase-related dioxygenase (phytanoyl-CoA dioxygenase family)